MLRSSISVLAALAIVLTAVPSFAGDHPHAREGFTIGLNLGFGTAEAKLDSDGVEISDDDRTGGGAGNFRLGYAVAPNVVLGLETSVWLHEEDVAFFGETVTNTTTLSVVAFSATFFPNEGGFFVRGGIGSGRYAEKFEANGAEIELSENGLGLMAALGYEWRLSRTFALGPQLDLAYVNIGEVEVEDLDGNTTTADVTFNYVNFSVLANWYF